MTRSPATAADHQSVSGTSNIAMCNKSIETVSNTLLTGSDSHVRELPCQSFFGLEIFDVSSLPPDPWIRIACSWRSRIASIIELASI
jgi:hypothetical protein